MGAAALSVEEHQEEVGRRDLRNLAESGEVEEVAEARSVAGTRAAYLEA